MQSLLPRFTLNRPRPLKCFLRILEVLLPLNVLHPLAQIRLKIFGIRCSIHSNHVFCTRYPSRVLKCSRLNLEI